MNHLSGAAALLVFPLFFWFSAGEGKGEGIGFNREIRPILSQNCFACHGPDEHERKAGLRLDERESALAERDGARVIDLQNIDQSLLLERIFSEDPEEVMPPPGSHKVLEAKEKETIRQWIAEGAQYEDHWAFVPPARSVLPVVSPRRAGRSHNAVDRFIQKRLQEEGLGFSPPADRATWLRRVSFDLTGLPPRPEETSAFVESEHLNASERELDRLLASSRYGERMALAWMDAARYGDSSVMHADGNRDMWPWRDWLIDAYNANKPFDDFTVEQLAGDLLPDATVKQRIASGFNRNHATSDEGGAIAEELRVEYVVDRVKTTANVWLALSMECGQCHDHKYDPISQKEYYEFFAYFNNTTDPGMQTRNGNQAPIVRIFSEAQQKQLDSVRGELKVLEKRREEEVPPQSEIEAWVAGVREGARRDPPEFSSWSWLGPFSGGDFETALGKNFGPEKERKKNARKAHGGLKWSEGETWPDGEVHSLKLPENGAGYLGREVETDRELKGTIWLGSDDGIKVWLNGKELHVNKAQRSAALDQDRVPVTLKPGRHWLLLKVVNASQAAGFAFRWESERYPKSIRQLAERGLNECTEEERKKLRTHYSKEVWPEGKELDGAIAKIKEREKALINVVPTSMIMEDQKEKPRVTYILSRGQYDQPRKDQPVEPGVPQALPELPAEAPANRLGLAQWLTRPDHPLTARVAVNRYWAMLFGQGIVKTVGDFGNQGAWPSHLDLLDWLAVDFVESEWDVKRTIRQIVLSAAYGQSSRSLPVLRERDPENRLLARASRFRLQGEFLRDQALAVSGLLVERHGGPGVKPYQPPNIWNEVSLNGGLRYRRDDGEKLYRRSLYTYWKRSAPMPNMMIFDAPSREKCALERPRTNTPLQALVTLNDPQFVEAARLLAQRLLDFDGTTGERFDLGYRLVAGRPATERETAMLEKWLTEQERYFSEDPDRAGQYLEVGEFPLPSETTPVTLASWTAVAQLMLNLDEALTRN